MIKSIITKLLREGLDAQKCDGIVITPEIAAEARRFDSDEAFLRAGGLSNEALDRAAFGFTDVDIHTLMPKQLNIKWKEDLENVKFEINHFAKKNGMTFEKAKKIWASKVDLSEPIEVVYEKNRFYIDDGHHRYFAAKILGKELNVTLEIKQNPIEKLSNGLDYDSYHRCVFNKVKTHE